MEGQGDLMATVELVLLDLRRALADQKLLPVKGPTGVS